MKKELKFIIKHFWLYLIIVLLLSAYLSYTHFGQKQNDIKSSIPAETQVSPTPEPKATEIKKSDFVVRAAEKTVDETVGSEQATVEKLSYYCDGFEGNTTANGEKYSCSARTCAHKSLPFGTEVEIIAENGNVTTCRVNDRGPYVHGRIFDLSPAVFQELAPLSAGVLKIKSWRVL